MILSIDGGVSIGAAALVKAGCDVVEGLEASESVRSEEHTSELSHVD